MADFQEFRIQVLALGMVPRQGKTLESIFNEAKEIAGTQDVDLAHPELAVLWKSLVTENLNLDWPESKYEPERSLIKRAMRLAKTQFEGLNGKYPESSDSLPQSWNHLFEHGKIGLLAFLLTVEELDPKAKVGNLAPMIDRFMDEIERNFENLLRGADKDALALAFRLEKDESSDFEQLVHGRLQPFSLARSLYFEGATPELRPMTWWTMHERFLPDLPA